MARFEMAAGETELHAAAGGGPDILFELGLRHCAGRDATLDLVLAHKWFNLAAMRGNQEAKTYRMEVSRDMSRGQIQQAQRLAREWLSKN